MKHLKIMAMTVVMVGMATQLYAQLDTNGISTWTKMYNSTASWEEGAFGANATGHPDYGWGIYNSLTHDLAGDSIFVIKTLDGEFKRLWIREKKSILNRYIFWYSDLDGSNEKKIDLAINDYSSKQFVNYSLSGDAVVNSQPASDSWDLVLNRFPRWYPDPGVYYTSTGFFINEGVSVSVYHAPDSATAATATLADTTSFTDSIAVIGNAWYDLQGMSIIPLDTVVFFIKDAAGEISKLQMTFFESGFSGLGRVGIRKQRLTGTPQAEFVNDTLVMGAFYSGDVYFSMSTAMKNVVQRDNWEIGFKTEQFSSSIRANIVSGVELYTYPNEDGSIWGPGVSTGPDLKRDDELNLYPVPASESINIRYEMESSLPLNFNIYDLTGKLVLYRTVKNAGQTDLQLDISNLHPGIYFLKVHNQEVQAVRKFTVR